MLPELRDEDSHEINALTKEFSSADVVLDHTSTVALLREHSLLIDDVDLSPKVEILR